jgi:signal transduction histidine kinase
MPEPLYPDTTEPITPVNIVAELEFRPGPPADYEQEDRALTMLAAELANNPRNMLQKLVETALNLSQTDTAGVAFLESEGGMEVFRLEAVAGVYAAAKNQVLPRDIGPCGVCVDENATQLMYLPHRHFPALKHDPPFVEILLIPFLHMERPVGTVWISAHRFDRKLNRNDERQLRKLSTFVSAAWQLWRATAALADTNLALQQEIEERRRAEENLRRAQKHLQNLPAMLVQAQETERRSLARELHDDFSQRLVGLRMEASALSKTSPATAEGIDRRIHDLGEQIGTLADDIHRMSRHLHPAILDDLGLEAALREECTISSKRLGIAVLFSAEDVPRSLSGDIGLCLLRVAQESLRNIRKHAGAREVRVRLVGSKSGLTLSVEDVGDGFDVTRARGKGGLGLISMEERMRLVNGELKIRSTPEVGTEIEAYVPLPEASC